MGVMSVRLVTFADGSFRWRQAGRRLERQAKASGWFESIHRWTSEDLQRRIPELQDNNPGLDLASTRGFGYWLWRPYILRHELRSLQRGESLLFLDAGCQLNQTLKARTRFLEYLIAVNEYGNLVMQVDAILAQWCKGDLLAQFVTPNQGQEIHLVEPGVLFMQKNSANAQVLDEWIWWGERDDNHYLDDSTSITPNAAGFVEHRHDQAILSCLTITRPVHAIRRETYFPNSWSDEGMDFPIWAMRNSLPVPLHGFGPFSRLVTWAYGQARRA